MTKLHHYDINTASGHGLDMLASTFGLPPRGIECDAKYRQRLLIEETKHAASRREPITSVDDVAFYTALAKRNKPVCGWFLVHLAYSMEGDVANGFATFTRATDVSQKQD